MIKPGDYVTYLIYGAAGLAVATLPPAKATRVARSTTPWSKVKRPAKEAMLTIGEHTFFDIVFTMDTHIVADDSHVFGGSPMMHRVVEIKADLLHVPPATEIALGNLVGTKTQVILWQSSTSIIWAGESYLLSLEVERGPILKITTKSV